jgi:hypothetical protein
LKSTSVASVSENPDITVASLSTSKTDGGQATKKQKAEVEGSRKATLDMTYAASRSKNSFYNSGDEASSSDEEVQTVTEAQQQPGARHGISKG